MKRKLHLQHDPVTWKQCKDAKNKTKKTKCLIRLGNQLLLHLNIGETFSKYHQHWPVLSEIATEKKRSTWRYSRYLHCSLFESGLAAHAHLRIFIPVPQDSYFKVI